MSFDCFFTRQWFLTLKLRRLPPSRIVAPRSRSTIRENSTASQWFKKKLTFFIFQRPLTCYCFTILFLSTDFRSPGPEYDFGVVSGDFLYLPLSSITSCLLLTKLLSHCLRLIDLLSCLYLIRCCRQFRVQHHPYQVATVSLIAVMPPFFTFY